MIKKYHPFFFLTLLTTICFVAACSKSSDQRDFEDMALSEPSGITATDASGKSNGNVDQDDWKVGPMYSGLITFGSSGEQPPYPNPLNYNSNLTIQLFFNVSDAVNAIEIRTFRRPSDSQFRQIRYIAQDELTTFNTITIPAKAIAGQEGSGANGLYRILIYDGQQNLISYGDVQIQ